GSTLAINTNQNIGTGTVTMHRGTIGGTAILTSSGAFNMRQGTVNAILDGTAGVNIYDTNNTGASTVTFNGVNTYSGTTTVSQGTLLMGVTNALPNNGGVGRALVVNGGTLDIAGTNQT